ncbi:MAG: helix-turn-helix domain-containing protein, partial [Bacteroidota bacterium]
MDFGTQALFFVSGLGVFNGFLMALYFLFFSKEKGIQNLLFGLLILMLSIRIGKSVLYYFDPTLPKLILQIGLSACLFIGPFLYFYLKSLKSQRKKLKKLDIYQLLGLSAFILIIGSIYPYASYPEYWNPTIPRIIYGVWIIYILLSAGLISALFPKLFSPKNPLRTQEKWMLIVFSTNALICLIFNSIIYTGYPSYILGPIAFSFSFYILLAFLLFYTNSKGIIKGEKKVNGKKKIAQAKAQELEKNLLQLMQEKEMYRKPDLKLEYISQELGVSLHTLSQFLNDHLGKGFSDFVNEYRVEAACKLLNQTHNLSIEGVGKEVGFGSRSSFYTA